MYKKGGIILMINAIDNMLNEFESGITLNINKITAVTEAAARELEINFKKCDLKVMTENGTDEDLSMLYEAAKSANTKSVTKAFEGFKDGVANAFNSLSKSASNTINTDANKETLSKLSEKIKFAPLLKKKEILSVDTSAIDKTANDALKKLDGVKAKIKSGVGSPSAEITAIVADFNKAIASVSDSANETKKKIESACSDCKSGMSKITSEVDSAKVKATGAINEAIELVKAGADPALAREWAKAKIEIIKASATAKANGLKSDIKEIAAAIKAYKTVQKDMSDEAKDDKAVKESTEDEATTTEEPVEETTEEAVSESTGDDSSEDNSDNEVVEEGVDLTPDDGDDLSEPVSMDGYGAALNMADPVSDGDVDAELASLEADTLTESEDGISDAEKDARDAVIEAVGGEEAWEQFMIESGASTEYEAVTAFYESIRSSDQHEETPAEVTVESVYEELFGEPMVESEQDKLDLQNLFNDIFEEATSHTESVEEPVEEPAEKPVEESAYDSLMNAILAL